MFNTSGCLLYTSCGLTSHTHMPSDAFCVSICIQWSLFWSQVLSSERSFECRRASLPMPVPPEWSGQREVKHCMSLFLRRGM